MPSQTSNALDSDREGADPLSEGQICASLASSFDMLRAFNSAALNLTRICFSTEQAMFEATSPEANLSEGDEPESREKAGSEVEEPQSSSSNPAAEPLGAADIDLMENLQVAGHNAATRPVGFGFAHAKRWSTLKSPHNLPWECRSQVAVQAT